jgi:N utilization substance protein B
LSRRTARKNAFLNLYQSDINNSSLDSTLRRWREYRGELEPYAVRLARGVREEQQELDATLAEVSEGWPLHRMSVIDRTILRLALYEMLYVEDVPPDVAINEAVELARGFSGEDAPAFVGGVLRGAGVRAHREVGHGR